MSGTELNHMFSESNTDRIVWVRKRQVFDFVFRWWKFSNTWRPTGSNDLLHGLKQSAPCCCAGVRLLRGLIARQPTLNAEGATAHAALKSDQSTAPSVFTNLDTTSRRELIPSDPRSPLFNSFSVWLGGESLSICDINAPTSEAP